MLQAGPNPAPRSIAPLQGQQRPLDLAVPVSPRAVLGLCPFAWPWAPQPGAAPHPGRRLVVPSPWLGSAPHSPPARWVPVGCPLGAGLVPTVTAEPPLPLSPSSGRAGIAAAAAGLDARCLEDLGRGGTRYPQHPGAGARCCPRISQGTPSPVQRGAGTSQGCHPHALWGPPWLEGSKGLSPPERGVPGAWLRLRVSSGIYRRAAGERSRSTQPCTRTHPGTPRGCSIPGRGHALHPPHHSQSSGTPGWGCKGRWAPARGCYTFGFPKGGSQQLPQPPPPLSGLVASPSLCPPCSPWRWGARGVGRRWPRPSVCGCCRNAGCRGRAPAACVSRPAPAAECTTKTTMAPPPHATGDGDVSSVRETGTLNPLRAEPQTSAACWVQGSGSHRGAALGFWGAR